jgi:ribosomal protein S12 methylthiotransferase
VGMVSLGCPKNLVDSEIMLGLLKAGHFQIARDVDACDVALINTCAFIEDSRKESIDQILELAQRKKDGKIRGLVVTGCLPQKYYAALQEGIAEIDALVGTGDYARIPEIIEEVLEGKKSTSVEDTRFIYDHETPRFSVTPPHYKYIKVGEGCDHRCSFCIIPELRGDYRSRPIESIVREAERFTSQGMKEAILISQDTSYYGRDLGGAYLLPDLLRRLNRVEGLAWIRLLYNHPIHVTDEILDAMAECEKVVKYMDIPLQHASNQILKEMKRGMTIEKTRALLEKMRARIPGLAVRTTFIVGYPGETEEDYRKLSDFVCEMRFERVGVFAYSQGDDRAGSLANQIPNKIKAERKKTLMELQQRISREKNDMLRGRTLEVLIDREDATGTYRGRTSWDAPDVDGEVLIASAAHRLTIGRLYPIRIRETLEYDLVGEMA